MSTYMWINLLAISIPLISTFHPRFKFYKRWNALWPALILPAIFFILWDVYFTDLGIWGFNPVHLSGIYILNLPLEEVLFFIAIPYACMFTYDVIKENIKITFNPKILRNLLFALALFLVVMSILNIDKLYTSTTFLLTAIFLLLHYYFFKTQHLTHFILSYLIIYLIPFFIVNGILTGSMISEPVVWYNDTENLGIRVLTIPVEDFVYGFFLYLMNVTIFEMISLFIKTEQHKPTSIKFVKQKFDY